MGRSDTIHSAKKSVQKALGKTLKSTVLKGN